ncbi:MAG: hypothetical protein M0R47_19015 [Methylobacter sp.]|uniref:hypothetical protein n=1 Tax=Methylobacter sp. TaxID=2051955 RepID=UPI0025F43978|nr:hypothetical protein [Methylobacter sp.]MCK9622613.1 hypothetical protein [Methylobacter sp.]
MITLKELNTLDDSSLLQSLRENKVGLIAEKKATLKFADNIAVQVEVAKTETQKKSSSDIASDTVDVTIVCNSAWFCDSHMDVLTDTAYDKSISARGNSIPHIKDHKHETTAIVGDVKKVYTKVLPLKDLGIPSDGSTTALLMDSTIRKDYDEKVFNLYKAEKINQHSIGLTYGDLQLALNSQVEEDKAEYEVWNKYYPSIINKELVDKKGYFWAVTEVDVRENSCVLFGANALTPTISTETKSEFTNDIFINKGANMATIEELQAEIIGLKAELTKVQNSSQTAVAVAVKEEQDRILGIQEAAVKFGIKSDVTKLIKLGNTVDQCLANFEIIAEMSQKENPSPKGEDLKGKSDPSNTKKVGGEDEDETISGLMKGFEVLSKQDSLFAGVR